MMNFVEELEKLQEGKISELKVQPKNFMDFQASLQNCDFRQHIIGEAERGGHITYRYK